jgi:uncharacterized protein involved in type VI secretion and phage assembly
MKGIAPTAEAPPRAWLGSYLAEVTSVKDLAALGKVEVRLLGFDGVGAQDAPLQARVAVPFSGGGRGAFLMPDRGDEVLVQFANGDPRLAVVVGGLWHGKARPPEQLGGDGTRIDRWALVGRAGTRIAIVEEADGKATISLTTPGDVGITLAQTSGGKAEVVAAGSTITVDTNGVTVDTKGTVTVKAAKVLVDAPQVEVTAAESKFAGKVECVALKATTVVSDTYLPGAGNIW